MIVVGGQSSMLGKRYGVLGEVESIRVKLNLMDIAEVVGSATGYLVVLLGYHVGWN